MIIYLIRPQPQPVDIQHMTLIRCTIMNVLQRMCKRLLPPADFQSMTLFHRKSLHVIQRTCTSTTIKNHSCLTQISPQLHPVPVPFQLRQFLVIAHSQPQPVDIQSMKPVAEPRTAIPSWPNS